MEIAEILEQLEGLKQDDVEGIHSLIKKHKSQYELFDDISTTLTNIFYCSNQIGSAKATIEEATKELEIDEAKQKKTKHEDILSEHFKTLKNLGVKSVVEGQKKIVILIKEVEKLEETIQEQFATLQENYEW